MNHSPDFKKILILLTVLGAVPAVILVALLRLKDGQLEVAGQAIAEYNLTRLFAVLISLMLPLFLLLPLASQSRSLKDRSFWVLALASPSFLFLPCLLAGFIIGGRQAGPCFMALLILSLLQCCLCLWVNLLTRLAGFKLALIGYGAVWAISEYVEHLRLYVLPYLEISWLRVVGYANWLLPQVKSGPSLVDDYLQAGDLMLAGLAPTLIQIPLLLFLVWMVAKRNGVSPLPET